MDLSAYPIIRPIMAQYNAELSMEYGHGMAIGMSCIDQRIQATVWLAELFHEDTIVNSDDKSRLISWFKKIQQTLAEDDCSFDLLLPDENTAFIERLEAFVQWCQGFLWGVGYVLPNGKFSATVSEILKDISEFTKLDTTVDNEADESDFVELVEYTRAAVLLLHSEFSVENTEI